MTRTDPRAHAQALLRLNPYESARLIVEQRSRYLGLENQASTPPCPAWELRHRRRGAEHALQELRSAFWSSPLPEIHSRLAALDLDGMPDLAASAARLAAAAALRPEIERLYDDPRSSVEFVHELRQIFILPPAPASQKKAELEQGRSLSRKSRAARKTARLIRKYYPEIHRLDAEWLDQIASTRQRLSPAKDPRESKLFWSCLIICMIIGRIILLLLRSH